LRSIEDGVVPAGGWKLFPCGVKFELQEGTEGQVRSRSGLALKHGVSVLNSPGSLDADYRGEICVLLCNHGKEGYAVKRGDRIAQVVFTYSHSVLTIDVERVNQTDRGEGGFGSTGV